MTIPDYMPAEFETDTYWSPRAKTKRHFWEEIQFRNALNITSMHRSPGIASTSCSGSTWTTRSVVPVTTPIAGKDGRSISRRCSYWPVSPMTILVPASLFYIALLKRASRIFAETKMYSGEFTLAEANQFMIDHVPFMEEDLGRYDLEGYLRSPGAGSAYLIGKLQVEELLFEREVQLGDDFDLKAFYDELLSKGIIPLTLIRWEMTGLDDEVKPLWAEAVGQRPSED